MSKDNVSLAAACFGSGPCQTQAVSHPQVCGSDRATHPFSCPHHNFESMQALQNGTSSSHKFLFRLKTIPLITDLTGKAPSPHESTKAYLSLK